MKLVGRAGSAMVRPRACQYGFICGATMIRLYRVVGLVAISIAVSNCAGPSTWLTTAELQPAPSRVSRADDAFWSTQPQPIRHRHHHPKADVASAAKTGTSSPPITIGASPRDSQASIDAASPPNPGKPGLHRWFGPDWQAEEKADMERLKRVTNICRC
jgi:hypothetical protein